MPAHSERLSRLRLLLGDDGLDRLKNSTVMVIGLGGVGSSCAEALARGGVGTLILLDRDVVEESNINRQALAFTSTLGHKKVDAMTRMVEEINPDCVVHSQQVFLTKDNVAETLDSFPTPDYVLDCIDTVTQKLAIAHWCASRSVRLLSSMGAANRMDPSLLKFANLRKTEICPLCKVIRIECRKRRIKGIEVLFSTEEPARPNRLNGKPTSREKGESLGSMSYMPPIMGQMIAGKVIRRLAGLEPMARPPRLFRSREEALALQAAAAAPDGLSEGTLDTVEPAEGTVSAGDIELAGATPSAGAAPSAGEVPVQS